MGAMDKLRSSPPRPIVLCVLDGWGHRPDTADNAIAAAVTPAYDGFMADCPNALLNTSGIEVGLPRGQMGNSEVGHLNLGAGRIVSQEIGRIDAALEDGSLARNAALRNLIGELGQSGGTCHLMGLLSPGGVHSHQDHIAALARVLDDAGVPVAIHAFLDGRDTPPASAVDYLTEFETRIDGLRGVRIATVCGRYYAMDRDNRWERIARAYAVLADGEGSAADNPLDAVRASHAAGITDEFVEPVTIGGYAGMRDGDGLLAANFRSDRMREILAALLDPAFGGFARDRAVSFADALGMAEYSTALNPLIGAMFHPIALDDILGALVSRAGLRQLRIAETEKYAHVTFFFNGGVEAPFDGEERILIPSPKVATYDLQPEMSAGEVTDRLVEAVKSGNFDFILVNYANPDMVGHTGVTAAAVMAIETVDRCLARLAEAVAEAGGALLITADHGNAETMRDAVSGEPHTAHTTNPVPVILVNAPSGVEKLADGRLADIAPTVLDLIGLDRPRAMTGRSLIETATRAKRNAGEQIPA
jgi:2,3-bisphosphoglycerate-independent phosphoglycerate mutase